MAELAVLDAGVALAWFIDPPSERRDYAMTALKEYRGGNLRFIVPDIFFVEVPYVLLKAMHKSIITADSVAQAARFIDLMTSDVVPSSVSVQDAIQRAQTWELKTYDATYFDLAVNMDIPLIAIDKDLVNKTKKFKVPLWKKKDE